MLLAAGGNKSPSADDVKGVLAAMKIAVNDDELTDMMNKMKDQDLNKLMSEGAAQLCCGAGGGGGGGGGAAAGGEAAEEEKKEEEEEEEDTPIVKELKVIDDEYLKLEREYEKEMQALQLKYEEKQLPFLQGRTKLLIEGLPGNSEVAAAAASGTPALKGFWCTALKNHPTVEDQIEVHDVPVLEYLRDITKSYLNPEDPDKGFKLHLHFVENPYFTNEVLVKTYHTEEDSPYTGDINVTEIQATEIDWKPGKNVTVEKVAKKVKGGGAKKSKQKGKESEEPRDSFFRSLFRNLKDGDDLPDDVDPSMFGEEEIEDEEEAMNYLMEMDHEVGTAIRDQVIAFAVRWYTGEAAPDDDDDEDEESESGDDDDDDESESESSPKGKKPAAKKKAGAKAGQDQPKQEECKQQ